MTVLLLVSAVLIMASMAQTTFAADSNITMTFKPIKAISPQTLAELNDTEWVWRPTFSIGDALIITENGQVTKYFYDDADYKGVSEVRGFFDDDGNALADRFRCQELGNVIYAFRPYYEWIDAIPSVSGQSIAFRLTLYEKGSAEGSEPIVKSDPIPVYIAPCCIVGNIQYMVDTDGTAYVNQVFNNRSEYTIRENVTMDDGKFYPVKHIGISDIHASARADGGSFMACKKLESITIPNSITTIKSYAFIGTPKVKEVTIPSTVKKIGDYAFGYDGDYDYFSGIRNVKKIPEFIIYAEAGSEGARYAKSNGFTCIDPAEKARNDAADQAYAKAKAAAEKAAAEAAAKAKADAEKAAAEAAAKAKADAEKAAAEKAKNTPAKVKITRVIKGKKKIVVKWKKISKATGYRIRYSRDKNFKKGVKIRIVRKYSKKGLAIKKPKKNKRLYIQVRAYKTVGTKTYYGAWSAKKSVKVR